MILLSSRCLSRVNLLVFGEFEEEIEGITKSLALGLGAIRRMLPSVTTIFLF